MSSELPERPRASAGHVWLRILLWLMPGVMTTTFLFSLSMNLFYDEVYPLVAIMGLLGFTVGAGLFDCVLHMTRTRGRHNLRAGIVIGWTIAFVATQVLLVPAILITAVLACTFVTAN